MDFDLAYATLRILGSKHAKETPINKTKMISLCDKWGWQNHLYPRIEIIEFLHNHCLITGSTSGYQIMMPKEVIEAVTLTK